jgi:hypothetical protein
LYRQIIRKLSAELFDTIILGIEKKLSHAASVCPGEILVDIPLKKRLRQSAQINEEDSTETADTVASSGSRPSLWVRTKTRPKREKWQDLFTCSPLASLLGAIEDHSGRKIRVFLSRELLDRLPARTLELLPRIVREELDSSVLS